MPMDWEQWQQKREGQGGKPPDFDKVVDNLKKFRGRLPSGYILVAIIVVIWLASGIFIVAPTEVGVVKRFGAFNRTTESGPHYHLPYPIESVMKPNVTQIRRLEIGFRTVDPGPPPRYRSVTEESLMLTGDENIVDVQFIVQFKIRNATNFLFKVEDPDKTVKDATEAAMREVIGENKVDEVLTAGKFKIQSDTAKKLQEILDKYESGFEVVGVQLNEVHPPQDVRAAFKDVASAREDQNRFINEAEGYANDILPKAKGRAAQLVRQAEAFREQKIKRSQGEAARFLSVLAEYRKAKDVTRKRLYLETMEQIVAKSNKFLLDPEKQSVLPLLPLKGVTETPPQPAAKKGGE